MHLIFPVSPTWPLRQLAPDAVEYIVDSGSSRAADTNRDAVALLLRARWGLPVPLQPLVWIEETMAAGAPPGVHLKRLSLIRTQTQHGWPAQSAHYALFTATGELIEERLGVFYRLLNTAAEVVLHIRDRDRYKERAAELERVLLGGDARWPDPDTDTLRELLSEDMTLAEVIAPAVG